MSSTNDLVYGIKYASYKLACVKENHTCVEHDLFEPERFELQRTVNIPDWETCSILCWAKPQCTGGWHYHVTGKICILYRQCTPKRSDDENNLVGDRDCRATGK